jgi:hypothetical protein
MPIEVDFYNILLYYNNMSSIYRRLTRLESRRPISVPTGRMISFEEMDQAMVAMYLGLDCNEGWMSTGPRCLWETAFNRFAD